MKYLALFILLCLPIVALAQHTTATIEVGDNSALSTGAPELVVYGTDSSTFEDEAYGQTVLDGGMRPRDPGHQYAYDTGSVPFKMVFRPYQTTLIVRPGQTNEVSVTMYNSPFSTFDYVTIETIVDDISGRVSAGDLNMECYMFDSDTTPFETITPASSSDPIAESTDGTGAYDIITLTPEGYGYERMVVTGEFRMLSDDTLLAASMFVQGSGHGN
jgi:hypothetical protein